MLKLDSILKEIKNVPEHRLEELQAYIHSLTPKAGRSESQQRKIVSFAGIFNDMSDEDYAAFLDHTVHTRKNLFDRNLGI